MPFSHAPRPLIWCKYERVVSLTRSLHLAEAIQSQKMARFQHRKLRSNVVEDMDIKVIWFSASQHLSDNNKYGNVSHTICIESIMERFGVHLYFIDQTITPSHTFTRVLLTPNSHENDLNNVGFNDYGTPLKLNPANQLWYHTTQCQNSRTLETHKHELEVAIEVNLNDLSWVYNNCVIRPNNHSKANSEIYTKDFGANHCNHYNYYGNICPSPFDEAKTRQILQEKCHKIIQTEAKLDAELKKEKRKSK